MSTLFGNLEIGRKSLEAHQLALQITSNNMSNVNTPGYSRQRVVFDSGYPVDTPAGMVGSGVVVTNIESVRDQFTELRLVQGIQSQSKEAAIFNSLNQIQAVFPTGAQQLQEGISRFFNSLSTLADNPESVPLRHSVVSAARNLASVFNSTARQLEEIQLSVNRSVSDAVNKANSLASSIATLNQQILVAEGSGHAASSLRDERQQRLNELAELVDVQYYETNQGEFNISVGSGYSLVTGNIVQPLSTVAVGIQGLYEVHAGSIDITSRITGGQIAGLVQVRDSNIPAYQNALDTLANTIINQVNAQHVLGTDLSGTNPAVNFFNPAPVPVPPPTLPSGAALSFSVNPAVISDVKLIAASLSGEAGDNANALKLASLANLKIPGSGSETFSEAYASLQFTVGTDTQSSQRSLAAQSAVLTQLRNQRDSASAVSLDEEAIDLVRFQRAYQAATKFISTIDQLTAELIATFST
jgi:flagellar hook-associated protein 1 FlgK